MAKRKSGRPRSVKPLYKISMYMEVPLYVAVRKRAEDTGESITRIILEPLRKDMKAFDETKNKNIEITYNNRLTANIARILSGLMPSHVSANIINFACEKAGTTPASMQKKHISSSFIRDIASGVKEFYTGCPLDIKRITEEIARLGNKKR